MKRLKMLLLVFMIGIFAFTTNVFAESKNEVTSTWPVVGNPDISFIPKPFNATPAIKGIEYFKVIIMKQTIKVKMNTARLENNLFNSIRKFSTLTRTFSLNSSGFLTILIFAKKEITILQTK